MPAISPSNTSDPLLRRVAETIRAHWMVAEGETTLVAYSGGADSTFLLHALIALGYDVEAAHFDHQTRGGESAKDAKACRAEAERLGLPFHLRSEPVEELARASGESFEMNARKRRYNFFRDLAEERGIDVVATGHHEQDNAESVLMQLIRGAGALGGIPPVSERGRLKIVRPLLNAHPAEIRAWLRERDIAWREDASNDDARFLRNRVRRELLPLLETYNPTVVAALARYADSQRADADFLNQMVDELMPRCVRGVELLRENINPLPSALKRHLLQRILIKAGLKPDFDAITRAVAFLQLGSVGQEHDISEGYYLYHGRDSTHLLYREVATPAGLVPLSVPGIIGFLGREFCARVIPPLGDPRQYCTPARQVFDAAKVKAPLTLRTRKDGDRFVPLGMLNGRKLSDYLIDRGVPRPLRASLPLVCSGENILWIVGHAPSNIAAVDESTEEWLEVTVDDAAE